jgi:hypothetical protein
LNSSFLQQEKNLASFIWTIKNAAGLARAHGSGAIHFSHLLLRQVLEDFDLS